MRNIDLIDPEKAIKKFDPDAIDFHDYRHKMSPQDELFKELYLDCGNATAAWSKAYPEKCVGLKPSHIRVRAHYLLKKYKLKGKNYKKLRSDNKRVLLNAKPEMVDYIKKQYEIGLLSEEELFKRMDSLSKHSTSDQTQFNATKEMRQWVREAKSEIEANKMSVLEVVPLMVDAISELTKEKYLKVLKGVRAKRHSINKEKNIIYDADVIRNSQRQNMINMDQVNVS